MTPEELKYTDQHEWVNEEGGTATVGITDHAQNALGDVTFVELPADDIVVEKNEEIATIESTKAASSIYAPVSGKIVEVNTSLEDAPEQVNNDPYGKGWMFKIEMADPSELDILMDAQSYEDFIA